MKKSRKPITSQDAIYQCKMMWRCLPVKSHRKNNAPGQLLRDVTKKEIEKQAKPGGRVMSRLMRGLKG